MFRTLTLTLSLAAAGCANFGATNGVFNPKSAVGGPSMVYATSDFNRGETQRAATVAGIARCDQLMQLVVSGQLPSGSVVNCRDAAGGFYSGPLYGVPGYYPYGGYGPSPSLLRDFAFTEQWQNAAAAAAESRSIELEAAARRAAEGE
jgi:hypothetical protein